jgi:two-component system, chemotaxis family, CheB/CheR fusion protein
VIVDSAPLPLLVLRGDLTLKTANAAFLKCFGLAAEEILDRSFPAIAERYCHSSALPKALHQAIAEERPLAGLEIDCQTPHRGARKLLLNASRIDSAGEGLLLLSIEDVTDRKNAERVLLRAQNDLRKYAESTLLQSKTALRRSRGELRALTASLLTAQEEERRRVSRELHDDLSQQVAMLEFDVERLEQRLPASIDDLRTQLREIRARVGSLSNDLRRIAYELHPSVLDHLGLAVALRSFSGEFSRREQMLVTFTCRRLPETVPQAVASCLYRVAQEAFRNIGKHAGKSPVKLSLVCKGQQLQMTVRDNGAGFDPASARGNGGLGIVSMHERVRLVHGSFTIQSSPGNGTLLTVKVPLDFRED